MVFRSPRLGRRTRWRRSWRCHLDQDAARGGGDAGVVVVVGGGEGGVGDGCFHWNRLLGDGFGSPKLFDLPKKTDFRSDQKT